MQCEFVGDLTYNSSNETAEVHATADGIQFPCVMTEEMLFELGRGLATPENIDRIFSEHEDTLRSIVVDKLGLGEATVPTTLLLSSSDLAGRRW